jgi:arylsulfatase A-like enzyme
MVAGRNERMATGRGSAIMGGLLAGATVGALAGAVEAVLFLEPANLRATPGSSILFFLLAAALYAVALAAAGALLGAAASFVPFRAGRRTAGPAGLHFSVVFGILAGLLVFVLGAWSVRTAPPDLAVFRRYCRLDTLLFALAAVVGGMVIYYLVRRIVRSRRIEECLSARATRNAALILLAAGATLLIVIPGLARPSPRSTATAGRTGPNVILITIDTLRADHLEYLGYAKPTSPVTAELAKSAVVFRKAIAQFPLTTPSHASILTARYVRSHGATGNAVPIHPSVTLISEILERSGYTTAAFVTSPLVGSKYGFDRGFDYFVERNRGDFTKSSLSDWLGQLRLPRIWWRLIGLDRTTAATLRWFDRDATTPFFLWIHQIAPHASYAPPFSYERRWDTYRSRIVPANRDIRKINNGEIVPDEADLAHITALYDAEIAFTEALLARVFDALRKHGLLENTLVVFTADHGESLYDRSGYIGHGHKLFDEEIVVPLFFYAPGLLPRAGVIDEPVETIHIAPTILDLLGLPPDPSFQGMSLAGIIEPGRTPSAYPSHPPHEKPAFSINGVGRSIRYAGWKYIEMDDPPGSEELYNLLADPGETRNLVSVRTERAASLRTLLRAWDASVPVVRSGDHELDEESIRTLRTLGYIE